MPEGFNLHKHRCDNLECCSPIVWRPVYVGFILDNMALIEGFLRVILFFSVGIIPSVSILMFICLPYT
jgi:hypothetical protein